MCSSLTLCVCAGLRTGVGLMLWTVQLGLWSHRTLSHGSRMIHDHFLRPGAPAGPPTCPQEISATCSDCSSRAACMRCTYAVAERCIQAGALDGARGGGPLRDARGGAVSPSRQAPRQMRVRAPPSRRATPMSSTVHCRVAWRRGALLTRRAGLCVPRQLVERRQT